ncbi:hypothetical protein LEN26_010267 [Aphanomyces euteiches]|nr:hypothetical protein LEN26_010267 [Aphanomyces euteiches]KAH9127245.1 hypothetical protein AeMF1_002423 [Aphanomyces euteiches]KAH9188946.1 hypothetical protein AeNC1_009082 [Aphanomyces euteiches]
MTLPSLKLTYFDMPGRGEVIRLALTIGEIPFQDERLSEDAWKEVKPNMPFKQIPVLTVDGQMYCQTHALARLASTWSGLYPKNDPLTACRVDEICDFVEEINQVVEVFFFLLEDPVELKAKCEYLTKDKLPSKFALLETRLTSTGSSGPWYLDSLTVADLEVYALVKMFKSGTFEYISTDIFNEYIRITTIYEAVAREPKVAAWNASHTK